LIPTPLFLDYLKYYVEKIAANKPESAKGVEIEEAI